MSDRDILSGELVFAGTRIPLAHVARLIAKGIDVTEILEDHPALTAQDVAFAAIHAKMKRNPGPPKPLELRRGKSSGSTAGRATADR